MNNDLNAFLFSTPEMTGIFSREAQLRAMMRFEWAFAGALERQGFAARGSATALESMLDCGFVDHHSLLRDAKDAGNIAIPFVKQLTYAVKERAEIASRAIH